MVTKQAVGLQTSLWGNNRWVRQDARKKGVPCPQPPGTTAVRATKPSMTSYRTLLGGPQKHGSDLTCLGVKKRSSCSLCACCKQTILASWPTKRGLFSPAVCLHILHFKCQGTVFQLQYSVRSWGKGEQVLIFTTIKKSYRKHLEGCLALPLTVYISKHPHLGVPFTILIATSLSVITGLLLKKLQQR